MTLHAFLPSLFLIFAVLFFFIFALSRLRLYLLGCGASFFAFCPAALGLPVAVSVSAFFIYLFVVWLAALIASHIKDFTSPKAIALSKTDKNGGYILYRGEVRRAYPRDCLYEYSTGDVFNVILLSDGTLCAYRL